MASFNFGSRVNQVNSISKLFPGASSLGSSSIKIPPYAAHTSLSSGMSAVSGYLGLAQQLFQLGFEGYQMSQDDMPMDGVGTGDYLKQRSKRNGELAGSTASTVLSIIGSVLALCLL